MLVMHIYLPTLAEYCCTYITIIMIHYLFPDAGEYDEERDVERGEDGDESDERDVAGDGGSVVEVVQGGPPVVAESVEPPPHGTETHT